MNTPVPLSALSGAPDPQNSWPLQAGVYEGHIGQLAPAVTIIGRPGPTGDLQSRVAGGHLLGRWRREFSEDSDLQFRAYYDRTHRDDPSSPTIGRDRRCALVFIFRIAARSCRTKSPFAKCLTSPWERKSNTTTTAASSFNQACAPRGTSVPGTRSGLRCRAPCAPQIVQPTDDSSSCS